IEFGAAYLAAAHDLDRIDHRRKHREHTLHALTIRNFPNSEAFVQPSAGAANADALIGLHARAVAFDHLAVDDDSVAGPEIRDVLLGGQFVELLFFELLDEVHG